MLLPFTSSLGMPTSSSSLTAGRTRALKSIGLETCSWVCGSRICSWGVLRMMKPGLWCAHMNVRDCLKFGVKSLKHFTKSKQLSFVTHFVFATLLNEWIIQFMFHRAIKRFCVFLLVFCVMFHIFILWYICSVYMASGHCVAGVRGLSNPPPR